MIEKFPVILEEPVFWGPENNIRSSSRHKAITDANTGKLFSIVSKNYRVIHHEEAIVQIESVLAGTLDLGKYEIETNFDHEGGRMRRTYRFFDAMMDIQPDDPVNLELHLFNSYDLSWPFMITLGAFRFVCANGLVIGRDLLYLKKRHVYELEDLDVKEEVSTALNRFKQQGSRWKRWTNMRLTPGVAESVIGKLQLGQKARKEVENRIVQESAGCNDKGFPIISMWLFFNVLTWYITHRAVSINHRVQLERRLRIAIMGLK